jgi:hypothetical protein
MCRLAELAKSLIAQAFVDNQECWVAFSAKLLISRATNLRDQGVGGSNPLSPTILVILAEAPNLSKYRAPGLRMCRSHRASTLKSSRRHSWMNVLRNLSRCISKIGQAVTLAKLCTLRFTAG